MEVDKSNMKKVIQESPSQLKDGLNLVPKDLSSRILGKAGTKDIKIDGNFTNVIVCGMGGSALPIDILQTVADAKVPIHIHRDYGLPTVASEASLVICISYSGNTEEVVSSVEGALSKKLYVIGISSGGKIEKICSENNLPFVKIPSGIQPRSATGYIFSAATKILEGLGLISETSPEVLDVAERLEKINPQTQEEGKSLAKKIGSKIPVVYASNNFSALARVWKIKFNENSKIPSFWNVFPELNHNEMVGYENNAENLMPIIIKDKADHPRVQKRMDLMAHLLSQKGIKSEVLNIREGSLLFKIFSSLLLGDWTSYYLALEKNIDPTPVKIVEDFKKLMAE